jgi:hypothetical protein
VSEPERSALDLIVDMAEDGTGHVVFNVPDDRDEHRHDWLRDASWHPDGWHDQCAGCGLGR